MFHVPTRSVVPVAAGDPAIRSAAALSCHALAVLRSRLASARARSLRPMIQTIAMSAAPSGGDQRERAGTGFSNRCGNPIDEDRRRRDAGQETDERSEQKVAPADVRRASDDIDDRERPDRHHAHEYDCEEPALAEPSRQVVQPSSGEAAHCFPAQVTADCERHRAAHRGADQRIERAEKRPEDDSGNAHQHRHREKHQSAADEGQDGVQRRQRAPRAATCRARSVAPDSSHACSGV